MTAGSVLGIGARLAKLRAMSASEIAYRIQYRLLIERERRQYRANELAYPDRLRQALQRDFQTDHWQQQLLEARRSSPSRFLTGTHDRASMRALFEGAYRRERDETLEQARRTREHDFDFFGRQFRYHDAIDWQADPVSGRRWPSTYHADVPVHRGDVGCGDVKYVWELSRQQYLIDLAKAHFIAGDDDSLKAMRGLVSGWIAANPYATGVNWACALEPAFRAWSWLWAYHLTADVLDEAFHIEWLRGFYDHGRFLARHLEHYSSPYNHLIGEAAALYALGHSFPEFHESKEWRQRGRSVLEGRLTEQFYADGGSVEQSTFYHHATLGFYLLAALIGRAHSEELSRPVWNAIERGLEFSMALTQPDGTIPAIGGADDGKPIRMEHLPLWDFRPYLAVGAVIFKRSDFKALAGRFYEDALWLLGPDSLREFERMERRVPAETSTARVASGYFVMRSDWTADADYVCVDCGEQAAGMRTDSIPNSMHGHADCLAVIASFGGRPVLVDSGLFAYNCGGTWEAHFRETAAHNTARVDGKDQARHLGKMAWSHSYRARSEAWMADARQAWTIGSHDGYARTSDGVTHRRAVWLRPGGYLLVYDEFIGGGHHDLEVNYQFAPGRLAMPSAGFRATFDDYVDITWTGSTAWSVSTKSGGAQPDEGWIAPSLGIRHAAPRLTLTSRMTGSRVSLLTVISMRRSVKHVDVVPIDDRDTLFAVSSHDVVDWVAAAGIGGTAIIDSDGLLSVCRMRGDVMLESFHAGGTYVKPDSSRLAALGASLLSETAR